jgi:hypothetical protein
MKLWIAVLFLVLLSGTAFFVFRPGSGPAKSEPVMVSPDNPFFTPKQVTIPFGTDKAEFGRQLFSQGHYDDAVSVYSGVFASATSKQAKSNALLMAAQSLTLEDTPTSLRYARQLYEVFVDQYPKEANADSAYYNLGMLELGDGNGPSALLHFTTLLQEYPESHFAANAALSAQRIAAVIEKQNETLKGRVLRIVGPFFPRNSAALVGILTSLASVLGWFVLYDWKSHYHKLIVQKDPLVWLLLLTFVALAVTNYLFEDQADAKSMLDLVKPLGKI